MTNNKIFRLERDSASAGRMAEGPVIAVLLVGGKGRRLWPLSTEERSKCFINFGKRKSLIETAIERMASIVGKKNIIIVIDRKKVRLLKKITKGIPVKNILIEPFGRDTAAAVGLAAIKLKPKSLMVVVPADQLVDKAHNFKKAIKEGINFVKKNGDAIVCAGTKPKNCSASFGYIKVLRKECGNIFSIDKFIEKPSQKKAKKFLKNKKYLWNAGIFIFTKETMLEAVKKHAPGLYKNLEIIKKNKKNIQKAYSAMKSISVDYQIMEKAGNLYCVKGNYNWDDIGNWERLGRLFKKDKNGNIAVGNISLADSRNCIIYNTTKSPIGIAGLKDTVVAHTDSGTLVLQKKNVEKAKKIIEKLI